MFLQIAGQLLEMGGVTLLINVAYQQHKNPETRQLCAAALCNVTVSHITMHDAIPASVMLYVLCMVIGWSVAARPCISKRNPLQVIQPNIVRNSREELSHYVIVTLKLHICCKRAFCLDPIPSRCCWCVMLYAVVSFPVPSDKLLLM